MNKLSPHLFYFEKDYDGSNDEPKRLLRDTASDARAYQNRPKTGRPRTGTTRPLPKKFTRVYILQN
jgi:hypothetical protein